MEIEEKVRRAEEFSRENCEDCRLGGPLGPRSGCDIRKKLVVDLNDVAWKHVHLFVSDTGMCKMWKAK